METTNNEMIKSESKFIIEFEDEANAQIKETSRYIFIAENHDKLNMNVVNFAFPEIASLFNENGKTVKVYEARGEGFKLKVEAVDENFEYGLYHQTGEAIKLKRIVNGEINAVKTLVPLTFRKVTDVNVNEVSDKRISFSCVNRGEFTVEFEIPLHPNTKITLEIFVEDCVIIDGEEKRQLSIHSKPTSKPL